MVDNPQKALSNGLYDEAMIRFEINVIEMRLRWHSRRYICAGLE